MKALITGDAGFVGRNLRRRLESQGWDVVGVDLKDGVDAVDFFRADGTRYDLALHCAAIVGGRKVIDGNPLSIAANTALDSLYASWLVKTRPTQAVYFSSSAAYDIGEQGPGADPLREDEIDLDAPRGADTSYGWAKIAGEQDMAFVRAEGVPVSVFRPFSGYGTDQDLDYPFPSIIARAVARMGPLPIWSDTVRDLIHIDDVVSAVLEVAGGGGIDHPVNLCTGIPTSFSQLAEVAMAAVGYSAPVEVLAGQPSGSHTRVGDPTRMLNLYAPRIGLDEGVARAVAGIL